MASRDRELKVVVLGDSAQAQRALGKLDSSVARTGANVEKTQSRLSKFGPAIAGGAALGGAALIKLGGDAIAAAGEARKVEAQTAAAIKSTGGAAKVSAQHVGDLAGELQKLSGVEDEAIQSGANMLLTFTNIRNEAGVGNNIFDQATRTLLDMSIAMGTDAKSSAIQLGKALNDPIAGISALSRVGVTFTEDQKAVIADMVATGNALGAQKIILAELNREFGGSAQAAGEAQTSIDRLRMRIDELKESMGGFLIEKLEDFERGLQVLSDWEPKGNLKTFLDVFGAALMFIKDTAIAAAKAVRELLSIAPTVAKAVTKGPGGIQGLAGEAVKKLADLVFHEGGPVTGPGEVPAVLQTGEYVIRRSAADRIGLPTLDRLNRLHEGGPVGTVAVAPALAPVTIDYDRLAAAVATAVARSARPVNNITNNIPVKTNASPQDIAREIAWGGRGFG